MGIRNREIAEWDRAHPEPLDPSEFVETITPGLRSISVRTIARATGLPSLYTSQIRRGLRIPHQRHWQVPDRLNAPSKAHASSSEKRRAE